VLTEVRFRAGARTSVAPSKVIAPSIKKSLTCAAQHTYSGAISGSAGAPENALRTQCIAANPERIFAVTNSFRSTRKVRGLEIS
jgi:hypothetical protein